MPGVERRRLRVGSSSSRSRLTSVPRPRLASRQHVVGARARLPRRAAPAASAAAGDPDPASAARARGRRPAARGTDEGRHGRAGASRQRARTRRHEARRASAGRQPAALPEDLQAVTSCILITIDSDHNNEMRHLWRPIATGFLRLATRPAPMQSCRLRDVRRSRQVRRQCPCRLRWFTSWSRSSLHRWLVARRWSPGTRIIGEDESGLVIKRFGRAAAAGPAHRPRRRGRLPGAPAAARLALRLLALAVQGARRCRCVVVPPGEIALVVAADGAAIPPERILGREVDVRQLPGRRARSCASGGERGPPARAS